MRRNYKKAQLSEESVESSPFLQFTKWFEQAVQAEILEPNAMSLATVSALGQPSVRIVLLKGVDARGFVFFTNYESHKGQDIAAVDKAALNFFWGELEQQIRIEGSIEKISEDESDTYYQSRDKGSRIGAWASPQSQRISHREDLEEKVRFYQQKFENEETIPRPPHWGGYRVVPHLIEFWQGRESRLHDRIVYKKTGETWEIYRVAP